jgi:hypothetical protein
MEVEAGCGADRWRGWVFTGGEIIAAGVLD